MIDNESFAKLIEALSDEIIKLGWTPPKKEDGFTEYEKEINLSLAIENKHIMEFCDEKSFDANETETIFGYLESLDNNLFLNHSKIGFDYCRYAKKKWLLNPNLITDKNITVVPEGLCIRALLRDNLIVCKDSHDLDFSINSDKVINGHEIIAYYILGTSQGWRYGWE